MLEEVVIGWQGVRWVWRMSLNFVAQLVQLLKHWLCDLYATCGQALSWRRTGAILLANAGCMSCSFRCISSICWAYFSDVMVSLEFRKLEWIRQAATISDHDLFFWCKFSFGQWFVASSQSSHWAGHHQLRKIHFSLQVTIWLRSRSLLLHRIREEDTSKWQFFQFLFSSSRTHLLSFSTLPICFKRRMTTEWSVSSSSPTSHVVVRG